MLEVHRDIIASYVRGHRDDRCLIVELSHEMCCRDSVEVGHDDIHQHQVVLGARIELVNSFETVKLYNVSKARRSIQVLQNLPHCR